MEYNELITIFLGIFFSLSREDIKTITTKTVMIIATIPKMIDIVIMLLSMNAKIAFEDDSVAC